MAQSQKTQLPGKTDTPQKRLGDILREERERRQLDFAQVSEITKLRPHILESLEKEEWDTLSAPVYIKGFLRTYAEALHLDTAALLAMYDEQKPPVDAAPRPLSSLSASRRSTPVFFLLLVLLAGAVFVALHFISTRESKEQRIPVAQSETRTNVGPQESPVEEAKKEVPDESAAGLEKVTDTAQRKLEKETVVASGNKQPTPVVGEKQAPVSGEEQAPVTTETTTEPPPAEAAETFQESPGAPAGEPAPPSKPLVLKADVRETTWVKIILDQGNPKEYIFRPGSHPEWRAEQEFEIFIGNAGGIALEFNGKKMDNLGGHGKVIHLKFPREEERDTRG